MWAAIRAERWSRSSGRVERQDHAHAARNRSVPAAGGLAAFIDAEHALDVTYAKALACSPHAADQPARHRRAGPRTRRHAGPSNAVESDRDRSGAALVPQAELEGDMADPQMGMQARLMTRPCASSPRPLTRLHHHQFIISLRQKSASPSSTPIPTTGVNALKVHASYVSTCGASDGEVGRDAYRHRTPREGG